MALIKSNRIAGAVTAVTGATIGAAYMHYLISQAKQGVDTIQVSQKGIVLCVLLTLLGLLFLALGDGAAAILKMDRDNLNILNVIVILVLVAVGFLGYWYAMGILESYGYS